MVDLNLTPGEWLAPLWDKIRSDSEADEAKEPGPDMEWWYYRYKHHWKTGDEALRMAPMQGAEAPTIEVRFYHQGYLKAAQVLAVYAEFALRDAWGDRYHVNISVREEPVPGINDSDEFYEWVDEQSDAAKDANILVATGGGWSLVGGGDTGVCQRAQKIARLHGSPLFVTGSTDGHRHAGIGMHELGHCLGFDHRDGGRNGSAVTPMGHYGNEGSTWSFRFHENVIEKGPEVQ